MKKLVLAIAFVLMSFGMNAQTSIGGGIVLNDNTAIEINSDFGINEQISVSPSFDYYTGLAEGLTYYAINVDGHYNMGDQDALNYYPLVGLGYHYISYSYSDEEIELAEAYGIDLPDVSDSSTGLNIGGGATYALSSSMKLLGELRYTTAADGSLGIVLGILFSFGG